MLSKTEKAEPQKLVAAPKGTSTVQIRVLNAALEERPNGDIILRGSIAPDSLHNLKTDDYQREVLAPSGGKKSKLAKGVAEGVTLPDIELGMRGSNVSFRGTVATLHDPVYIIDGLQRVSALIAWMDSGEGITSTNPLGATIHFSTTKEWEKQRFSNLNQLRTPVSPNVLLRNARDTHPSVLTLFGLSTNDPSFALYQRVCWNQRMSKGEVLSAAGLVRAAASMHRHIGERTLSGSGARAVGQGTGRGDKSLMRAPDLMDRIAKEAGLSNFRENVKDYFDLIDVCWGIRTIEYAEAQGHLRGNFLSTLGNFLARNPQLWRDESMKRLSVDAKTRARLKLFPVNDPEIRRLASAGTMVLPTLYTYLLEHMNKGKSKHKFR